MMGLTKRFGALVALDNLTLDVAEGEVFGFLGPNGAGKSTTLRLLLGFIQATGGSAEVMGIDTRDVEECHRHLAYVPGDVSLWPKLTGEECLELLGNLHGSVDRAYRTELVARFDLELDKRSRTYSKGNRQKVAVIAAFATRADVLLLDEPTSGLDPLMEREFRRCVDEAKARGQTVFLSSHILSEVEHLCDARRHPSRWRPRGGRGPSTASSAMRSTEIEIDFDGPPPDISHVEGVAQVHPTPTGIRVTLNGPPGPVLKAIESRPVTALRSEEASLEEIFLAYYGDGDRA